MTATYFEKEIVLTRAEKRELLEWWLWWHSSDKRLAAALLGVHVRTLERWIRAGSVPCSTANLLEQLRNGLAFPISTRRTAMCRWPWNERLKHLI